MPQEKAEPADPLEAIFAMVHGVLINVRFPPGPDGKPNYADAWSAMIDRSFSVECLVPIIDGDISLSLSFRLSSVTFHDASRG